MKRIIVRCGRAVSSGRIGVLVAILLVLTLGPMPSIATTPLRGDVLTVVTRPAEASQGSYTDASGLEVVTEITQARPRDEAEAQALSEALDLAEANPDDFGYPWIDPAGGTLVLSTASDPGRALAEQRQAGAKQPVGARSVALSFGKLEAIKHEITTLSAAGIPDADLIYQTTPDHLNNRIIVTVSAPSRQLYVELAERYGTEAIAVQVDSFDRHASTLSRANDGSPFYGGARINTPGYVCSDSFAWMVGTTADSMLTAAHCIPSGGAVSTTLTAMGSVTANSGENWSTTTGTTYYTNQTAYRGDVALIRITSPKTSYGRIYRGGTESTTSSLVLQWRNRYSVTGDLVFTGGQKTGEIGTYYVNYVGVDRWYSADGPFVWARNITEANKSGSCVQHGDSGGSVFSLLPTGVIAAGTISGMGLLNCSMYFTDIYRSYLGLPGTIVIGS